MKRISVCLILGMLAAFSLPADESDVIVQAQTDAAEDGQNYHPLWWGVGGVALSVLPVVMAAFFGDALPVEARRTVALTVPVLGGGGLALVGYSTGRAELPDARIAEIQIDYGEPSLLSLYESEYEKTLTKIQRRKRGNHALIGLGASVGAMGIGFLVVYLTK
jgi:hypothetical protein